MALLASSGSYARDNHGSLRAQRAKLVRGIALRTDELAVPEWITLLAEELAREAQASAEARAALEHLLLQ